MKDGLFKITLKQLWASPHFSDQRHMMRRKVIEWEGGYGDIICGMQAIEKGRESKRMLLLTTTGVIIIFDKYTNMIITAWLATAAQVKELFGREDLVNGRLFEKAHVPKETWKKIRLHQKSGMSWVGKKE